jgi:hypothetical protein
MKHNRPIELGLHIRNTLQITDRTLLALMFPSPHAGTLAQRYANVKTLGAMSNQHLLLGVMLSLMLLTNIATGLHELACIGLGSPLYKSTGNKLH